MRMPLIDPLRVCSAGRMGAWVPAPPGPNMDWHRSIVSQFAGICAAECAVTLEGEPDAAESRGSLRPIRIGISLRANAGFFQVENVLCPKINIRPVKGCIELHAGLKGKEPLQYL